MKPATSSPPQGFTLIELMVVMAILILLFSFVAPVSHSVLDSFRLKQALNAVQAALDEAKERSISLNRPVDVWVCRSKTGPSTTYRFIQIMMHEPSGKLKPIGRIIELPTGVCVTANDQWSSVMGRASNIIADLPSLGSLKADYEYRQITFYPSGSTNLSADGDKWFLTVMNERSEARNVLAKNFATILIDPVNGLTSNRQP